MITIGYLWLILKNFWWRKGMKSCWSTKNKIIIVNTYYLWFLWVGLYTYFLRLINFYEVDHITPIEKKRQQKYMKVVSLVQGHTEKCQSQEWNPRFMLWTITQHRLCLACVNIPSWEEILNIMIILILKFTYKCNVFWIRWLSMTNQLSKSRYKCNVWNLWWRLCWIKWK